MKILLDENVDHRLKKILESYDHEVKTTFEESLTGETDRFIYKHALEEDFVILTHDDDFLSIVDQENDHPSIVYMP